jgi:hypothetical protein
LPAISAPVDGPAAMRKSSTILSFSRPAGQAPLFPQSFGDSRPSGSVARAAASPEGN